MRPEYNEGLNEFLERVWRTKNEGTDNVEAEFDGLKFDTRNCQSLEELKLKYNLLRDEENKKVLELRKKAEFLVSDEGKELQKQFLEKTIKEHAMALEDDRIKTLVKLFNELPRGSAVSEKEQEEREKERFQFLQLYNNLTENNIVDPSEVRYNLEKMMPYINDHDLELYYKDGNKKVDIMPELIEKLEDNYNSRPVDVIYQEDIDRVHIYNYLQDFKKYGFSIVDKYDEFIPTEELNDNDINTLAGCFVTNDEFLGEKFENDGERVNAIREKIKEIRDSFYSDFIYNHNSLVKTYKELVDNSQEKEEIKEILLKNEHLRESFEQLTKTKVMKEALTSFKEMAKVYFKEEKNFGFQMNMINIGRFELELQFYEIGMKYAPQVMAKKAELIGPKEKIKSFEENKIVKDPRVLEENQKLMDKLDKDSVAAFFAKQTTSPSTELALAPQYNTEVSPENIELTPEINPIAERKAEISKKGYELGEVYAKLDNSLELLNNLEPFTNIKIEPVEEAVTKLISIGVRSDKASLLAEEAYQQAVVEKNDKYSDKVAVSVLVNRAEEIKELVNEGKSVEEAMLVVANCETYEEAGINTATVERLTAMALNSKELSVDKLIAEEIFKTAKEIEQIVAEGASFEEAIKYRPQELTLTSRDEALATLLPLGMSEEDADFRISKADKGEFFELKFGGLEDYKKYAPKSIKEEVEVPNYEDKFNLAHDNYVATIRGLEQDKYVLTEEETKASNLLMDLHEIIDYKTYAPKTQRHYFVCLSTILSSSYKLNLIKENPAARISAPKVPRQKPKFLNLEEARKILELLECEELKYQVAINILLYTRN